jgi:serine/threonine protein kinase
VAPEQAKGRAIDARVDIYSLGCVAFEMLAGRPPFVADNAMEMVAKHLMEAPPSVSSLVPSVPEVLDDIIVDMLAKEREQRPTMTEVMAALDRGQRTTAGPTAVTSGISITKQRIDVPSTSVTQLPQRRGWLAVVGLILIGIVAGAVTFMVVSALKDREDSERQHEIHQHADPPETHVTAPH